MPEDHELMKNFVPMTEGLLRDGLAKPPRIFLNRRASGLEGVLKGIRNTADGKVSGGRLE